MTLLHALTAPLRWLGERWAAADSRMASYWADMGGDGDE